MTNTTWRAKRSLLIDIDFDSEYPIVEGQTYTDDGTTTFSDYICDELFAPASAEAAPFWSAIPRPAGPGETRRAS